MERRLAAVLIADVVGYGRLSQIDEEGTRARFQADLADVFGPKIATHHGRLIKTMGDGLLVEFHSVVDALRCAVEVQQEKAKRNAATPAEQRLDFRIGVNLGDVIVEGDDIHGDGVNIADRIQALAEPGGVAISGTAYDQVKAKLPIGYASLGEQKVKSIAEPIRVYRVLTDPKDVGRTVESKTFPLRRARLAIAAGLFLFALLVAAGAWLRPWMLVPESSATERSIAVLPFKNLSDDAAQEYLADGITEDLTTDLARIPGLFVTSRNAAFTYKGKDVIPSKVAAELGVRHILEGSIRRVGDDLRINAQLIDAQSGGHLWAERFDGTFADVITLQDRVIADIAAAMELQLGPNQTRSAGGTSNPLAYDAYLHGLELFRRHWHSNTAAADLKKAIDFFEHAIALDPNFGRPYGGLAAVYQQANWFYAQDIGMSWREARDKAHEYREEALKHPSAWAYRLAARHPKSGRLHDEAIENLGRAIALDPSDPENYHQMAYWLILAGRVEDGQTYIDAARRVDPRSDKDLGYVTAAAEFSRGRFVEAAAAAELDQVNYPNDPSMRLLLASIYGHLGRIEDAKQQYEKAVELYDEDADFRLTIMRARDEWPFKEPADADRLAEGLRKAGVPDLPFGYDPTSKDRLRGDAIKSLIFGHTVKYRNVVDAARTAATTFTTDGKASLTAVDRVASGYAVTDDHGICIFWEKAKECAAIFRNPTGSRDQGDEFVWVNEGNRWAFIVE